MEPNPFFASVSAEPRDPCGHMHRTFAGAAGCAIYRRVPDVMTLKRGNDAIVRLMEIRSRDDIPPGESDEMLIEKVYNNRRMAYFEDNSGRAERVIAITQLEPGETEFLSVGCYLRAPWNFEFGQWYTLAEAAEHNHVPYINVDGMDGEAPGIYVNGVPVNQAG